MLKITIEGPQGTKKTLLAEAIRHIVMFENPDAKVLVCDGDDGWVEGAMWKDPTHRIETKLAPSNEE